MHECLDAVDLVEGVDDDATDATFEGEPQLRDRLGVAVQHETFGREAGLQREAGLTAGGDVEEQALLRDESRHRSAEERLARIRDRIGAERRGVLATAFAQFVLVVDVERRAVLTSELLDVAATE